MRTIVEKVIPHFVFIVIFLFVFRDLLFNISTSLYTLGDSKFIIWQIYQSIVKFQSFNFNFETNAFYPTKYSLLFSDSLIPLALVASFLDLIFNNPILVFNLIFIINFFLNYFSLYFFWGEIFEKRSLKLLGALLFIFSPFFFNQYGHFQMQTYWSGFFSLYFISRSLKYLSNSKYSFKYALSAGIFLFIQFLNSVYLAIFFITALFIYITCSIFYLNNRNQTIQIFKVATITIITFCVLASPFIIGYFKVKRIYNINRDIREIIQYSAHLSDYLFTSNIRSFFHTRFLDHWNSFDRHLVGEKASFIGFLILILVLIGGFSYKSKSIIFKLNKYNVYFLLISIIGFWFSLGPRLSFNGVYVNIPTGYNIFLKILPFIEVIRAPARWSFLFYLGITYFSLNGMNKIMKKIKYKKNILVVFVILLLWIIEYIPLSLKSYKVNFKKEEYSQIIEYCKHNRNKILLEIPVTHFSVKGGIYEGLNYITQILFSSLFHKCRLVNGYSGYDPNYLQKLDNEISMAVSTQNIKLLNKITNNFNIDIIKVNVSYLNSKKLEYSWKNNKFKFDKISNKTKIYIVNDQSN